jgi:hypothetical protein
MDGLCMDDGFNPWMDARWINGWVDAPMDGQFER